MGAEGRIRGPGAGGRITQTPSLFYFMEYSF